VALINLESARNRIMLQLKSLETSHGLEVLSYKRNRGVGIFKEKNGTYLVRQNGYLQKTFQVKERELPKLLKSIFKKEFPRSRKVRIYALKNLEDINRQKKKL
jgi:hypothetical protein